MSRLKSLTIEGFKSIRRLDDFELGDLTVLIGPNGAGKSNFVEFFRLLRQMADESLQQYAQTTGPENLFFDGPKRTPKLSAHLEFDENVYEFDLLAVAGGGVTVGEERAQYKGGLRYGTLKPIGGAGPESCLKRRKDEPAGSPWGTGRGVPGHVYSAVSSWTVYHVHDTSLYAPMRGWCSTADNAKLAHDASNLAAVLLHMRDAHGSHFNRILDTVRLAAPFIDELVLRPQERGKEEQVRLDWLQRGSQRTFQATVLSDGTIRFIALITALLQPNRPSVIVVDEPELGLHPFAINLIGEAIQSAATSTQVVVATQSPQLLDNFSPEHVVVVERDDGQSQFRRLDPSELASWLQEYSLGELWMKNLLGGRPARD